MKMIYSAAAYLRLSSADGDKDESNSITNQRSLIEEFVKGKENIVLCSERVDDGYSGVDFNRPGLQAMLQDIKAGRINCVIVKDLSRFGRNYIDAGYYLEKIFPYLGVRFIAINDYIDSISEHSKNDNITIPFKNLMNDAYSRDISIKIRSQFDIKRKRGEFIGSFAVYGYLKEEKNPNHLVADVYAAQVIQDIFRFKLSGMSQCHIAKKLNEMGILSPSEYKISQGFSYHTQFQKHPQASWSPEAVTRILTNEMYLGHMVQGKWKTPNHKVKKRMPVPHDKWMKVENIHVPIIKEGDFLLVQKLLALDTRTSPQKQELYLLSGFLFCGSCEKPMTRKLITSHEKKYPYYMCTSYKRNKALCQSHLIQEIRIKDSLNFIFHCYIKLGVDFSAILKQWEKDCVAVPFDSQLARLQTKILHLQSMEGMLLKDYQENIFTEEEYKTLRQFYTSQIEAVKKQICYLHSCQENMTTRQNHVYEWLKVYEEGEFLDRAFLIRFVEKICVYEKNRIQFYFHFHLNI